MSSRKGSSKMNSSSHSSSSDSSANEVIAPKDEFEVEEEAKDVYYKALCGSPAPSQDIIPKRPVRSPNAPLTPSVVSPDYLTTLRDFYQIPSEVVFRIPSGNESAKNPPEGFFICYEASLVYCRMWFPIPGTIVCALHHFGLSISQLSVPALQHWLGVLISSYELGMDLNPGDFEGFWFTRGTRIDGSYRMAPKKGMAIIQGHTSHPKAWFEHFFFVRLDGESVEESYLHLFRREWNFTRVNRILPPTPADLFAKRGKRAIVAEMKRRADLFATEFESFKDAREFVGDFRECRGSVSTLYKSQNEDFSFPAEVAEMSGLMNGCAHAEVSEDTAEAGTGVGDEGAGVTDGEVDQPVSSFGISMSGFLNFEL
uniref:Uncharacterized protein n=1 Tax=Brassica oleracea var. oleracea TaxID=109376 RepID=A0A0D3D407_BRAOL